MRVVSVLAVILFLAGVAQSQFVYYLSPAASMQVPAEMMSWGYWGVLVAPFGGAFWALALSRVAARWGRRNALTAGLAVAVVGALVLALAFYTYSFPLHLLGLVLLSPAAAVWLQARFIATDVAPSDKRGLLLGLAILPMTLGLVVGSILLIQISEPIYQEGRMLGVSSSLSIAIICAIALALSQAGLRPDPLERAAIPGRYRLGKPAWVAIGLIAVAQVPLLPVSYFALNQGNIEGSEGSEGTAILVYALGVPVAMYTFAWFFGLLTDRFHRETVALGGLALQTSALILVALAPANPGAGVAAMLLVAFGWSAVFVAASTLLVDVSAAAELPIAQGRADAAFILVGTFTAAWVPWLSNTTFVVPALILVVLAAGATIGLRGNIHKATLSSALPA